MKIIKNALITEAEELISEQKTGECENFILDQDDGGKIWLEDSFIRVPEVNMRVDIYEGTFTYVDEDGLDQPDHNLYVFFKEGSREPKDVIYMEGGSALEVAIHNFSNYSMNYIENVMKCDVHVA